MTERVQLLENAISQHFLISSGTFLQKTGIHSTNPKLLICGGSSFFFELSF
jgi:hypothetical protein